MGRAHVRAGLGLSIALALLGPFGSAHATEGLQQDTRELLLGLDRTLAPACGERTFLETEGPRWVLDRCGTRVAWDVHTAPALGGGTIVSAAVAGSVPAATAPLAPSVVSVGKGPLLARTFVVTDLGDSGPGSLTRAILDANAARNGDAPDRIRFEIPSPGPHTIALLAPLPAITDPVAIDGGGVELDGSRLPGPAPGLRILAGTSTVRGLRIRGFGGDGIRLEGEGGSTLEGNAVEGCATGIAIVDSADNRIVGNTVTGSAESAVRVVGDASTGNRILGNRILRSTERGIDLAADGGSAAEEPGPGPNRFQPAPALATASFVPVREGKAVEARIEGILAAAPGTTYHVELFATAFDLAEAAGPSGDRLLAVAEVATGPDGVAGLVFRLPEGVRSKDRITATATDLDGNTSEFSNVLFAPSLVITWNTGTGSWGTAANWLPAQLPAAGDTVVIAANGANTTFTVTLNADATISGLTVGGGSGVQTLSMASQTLTLNGPSTVSAGAVLSQSGGTIAGTGTLTIQGTYNWTGGLQTGTGTTTVNGTFSCAGIVAINGGRTLNNATMLTWNPVAGFGFRTGTGSVINNSGTWDSQSNGVIVNFYGGATTFNNTGTFRKSAGTGTTSVSIPFNHNGGTLAAQSGLLTMNGGGSSVAALSASTGATLQFGGGTWDLNAGTTFAGSGTVSIFTAGTVNVNAAMSTPAATTLDFSAGTLGGTATFTLNGPFLWTGGLMTGAGTTTVNATFNCSGIVAINGGRTLNNATTLNWNPASGDGFRTGTGSIINNTGTWDSQSNGVIINHYGGATTFNNTGTFKKSAGTGATTVSIPFTHLSGTIDAQSGTLTLNAGGTSAAALSASLAAGTLQFGGGTWNLNAGTTVAGPGTVSIFTAGTVNVNAALTIPLATTFDFSAGTLGGTATLTLNGPFVWTGGLMTGAGTTTVNGAFTCSGIVALNGGRIFNNATTMNWNPATGSGFRMGTGAVINNTGTWDSQSNGVIVNFYGGAATVNNTGIFRKSAGTGTTSIGVPLNHNGGTIDAQSGLLTLNGGGVSVAPMVVSGAAATLQFGGGTWDLNAGTAFSGPGTVSILTASTVSVNAAVSTAAATTLSFTAGTLQGAGTLTLNGPFEWTAGLMTAAATTQVNGAFTCAGIVGINNSRVLNTAGATTWNPATGSGIRMGTGAVINNSGTWDATTNGVIVNFYGGAANFNNLAAGTFKKSAGTGITAVNVTFANAGTVEVQSGTLQVNSSSYTQTAGTTKLTGGALSSTTVMTFQGGTLAGSGTVTGPVAVTSSGALAPGLSAGTLSLVGSYTQSGGGAYRVEIGGLTAGTQFDRANVSGAGATATLGGTLQISLISGFVPAPGDTFTVLTYPSRTGAFTVVPPAIPCLGWRVDYGATALTLTALQLPGEVTGFGAAANKDLTWNGVVAPGVVTFDLMRGNLRNFPVGTGPGEVCLAPNTGATTFTDAALPAAGQGFWYVIRQDIAGCGVGSYGSASSGAPRVSAVCP